jgi:hypothetical protein
MTETRKLRVFLCHSSQDKPIVRELYQRLNAEGWIDPWLDEEKLLPGQDWDMEIEKAVEAADAVIVFLSNGSVTKEGYVQKELRKVLDVSDEKSEGAIFVIPVRINEVQIPRRIKMWQYVDFFPVSQKSSSYIRLIASLKKRAEKISLHIGDNLSIENEIAIEIRILDKKGLLLTDFYFLTKPDVTVERLLENVKMQYPKELPDIKEKYMVALPLPVNKFLNNLTIENESLLVIFPIQPDDKK